MKKLGFLFLLASAFGQSTSGPFVISSGTSACAQIRVSGQSAVGITVVGTFSATLQPKVSIQGQTPTNIQVTPSSSSAAQSTITAVGNYTARVGGYDVFSVCVTAYTSGSATIYLNATQASASLGGTDGSSGGSTAFSAITSGTNTTAAMHVDTGASLDATGSGTIAATSCPTCASSFPVTGTTVQLTDLGGGIAFVDSFPVAGNGIMAARKNFTTEGYYTFAVDFGFIPSATNSQFRLANSGYYTSQVASESWIYADSGGGTDVSADKGDSAGGSPSGKVLNSVSCYSWGSSATVLDAANDNIDTTICRNGATGAVKIGKTGGSDGSLAVAILATADCAVNSVSPAACGSAASGAFVVPTTTSTYTVNTTATTTNAHIFLQARIYTGGLPGTPTCVAPAVTSAVSVSARTAATSFTFALPSTVGQTCWDYWIVSN